MYADDTKLFVETAISDVHLALNQLRDCILDVKSRCSSRILQLNDKLAYIVGIVKPTKVVAVLDSGSLHRSLKIVLNLINSKR